MSDQTDAGNSDKTRHSLETDFDDPGGIRTHNISRRAAADPRLRRRGHWDRHFEIWLQVSLTDKSISARGWANDMRYTLLAVIYRYAPHNDVSVKDGPHIRRLFHKIIKYYNIIL
jgi:hypothetical protein